jgi:hypothetical protein
MSYSYTDLALQPQTQAVQFSPSAEMHFTSLRVCHDRATALFVIGTPEAPEFYRAEDILDGLLHGAADMELPLPPALPTPAAFDDLDKREQLILVTAALGAHMESLVLLAGSKPALMLVMDKASALGFMVAKASDAQRLGDRVRADTTAAIRSRLLEERVSNNIEDATAKLANSVLNAPFMQIVPGGAAMLERLERMRPDTRSLATRMKWPFKDMEIGDVVRIPAVLAKRAQTAVHVYGARMGKRFATANERGTGVLTVTRLRDKAPT